MIINALFLVAISAAPFLISGCSAVSSQQPKPHYSSHEYLQRAKNKTGNSQQSDLLAASNQLIEEHQLQQAKFILNQINKKLPPDLNIKKNLVQAKLLVALHQNQQGLALLKNLPSRPQWPTVDRIEWHTIAAKAYKQVGDLIDNIEQESALVVLENRKEKKKDHLRFIWQQLEGLSPLELSTKLANAAKNPVIKGWLALISIMDQTTDDSPEALSQALTRWKETYPWHPALALLPSSSTSPHGFKTQSLQSIALLLPLEGPYGKEGTMIRNGFLASYYQHQSNKAIKSNITIIDTSHKEIAAAYQEALAHHADFIVGPLTKANVAELLKFRPLKIPTLSLNAAPSTLHRPIKNFYEFGLLPLDEAKQAAAEAWNHHKHNALILTPDNKWGKAVADAFERTWNALGGRVINQFAYQNQRNLSVGIRHFLHIDQAEHREMRLRSILHDTLRYTPRRRQDVDLIFMVATPKIARQIRPLLHYYYAGDLPIYSISNVCPSEAGNFEHDLDDIHFPDMPWVLNKQLQPNSLNLIRSEIKKTWPKDYARKAKLFALGVDAYTILTKLNKISMFPELGTPAATGILYLDRDHHIYRKLIWFTIHNGKPHAT